MITNVKVLDNFYNAPDSILKLVNDFPITGCGTGARSIDLQQLDLNLGNDIKNALCQIHGVNPNQVKMNTFFMEHEYNHKDEIFNTTTIHMDGKNPDICRARVDDYKLAFCGQILLTKNPDPEAAVTIHNFKTHIDWDEQEIVRRCIDEYTIPGELYRAGKIDLDKFKEMRKEHADNFDLTCEIKNVYNRMVSWRGGTLHAQRITKSIPKVLNQYFFFEWL